MSGKGSGNTTSWYEASQADGSCSVSAWTLPSPIGRSRVSAGSSVTDPVQLQEHPVRRLPDPDEAEQLPAWLRGRLDHGRPDPLHLRGEPFDHPRGVGLLAGQVRGQPFEQG